MSHTAEIIAVGTELLLGHVVNTNARDISRALSSVGVEVLWHTSVDDDPARLSAVVETARSRANIIITTGGLGPTYDDLTRETVCGVFGRRLVLREDVLAEIRAYYQRNVHLHVPENNRRQAELPEGCMVFDNPVGTAPGCAFEEGGVHVIMLPGPPFEMLTMLERHVLPYLRAISDQIILSRDIMTFGLGESAMEEMLRDKMIHMTNPTLATYAKPSEVTLRATARADTMEAAEALLSPVVEELTGILGDIVYGVDVSGLEEVCVRLLKEKGLTLATAESCTGGRIASGLTALPGVSAVYRGGVVSYWTSVKGAVLGVPQEILDKFGAVSEECARAMAEGACRTTGAEIGVSVTGVAGPDPDERGTEVGIVYIGLATPDGTFCRRVYLGKRRRDRIQSLAVNHALDAVRRYLSGLPVNIE